MSRPRAIDVCRVADGSEFHLADHPADWSGSDLLPSGLELRTKKQAVAELEVNRARLVAAHHCRAGAEVAMAWRGRGASEPPTSQLAKS